MTPNTSVNFGWAGGRVPSVHGKTLGAYKAHYSQLQNSSIVIKYSPFTEQYLSAANLQFGTYIQDSAIRLSQNGVNVGKISIGPTINPYVGFGYAPKIDAHWGVNVDLGAIYQSKQIATINGNRVTLDDRYSWLPVAKAGVSYHF